MATRIAIPRARGTGIVKAAKKAALILQFRITLTGIAPAIWRRVQVPADYSFWDLHVAIQDAMGWLDYRLLHTFRVPAGGMRKPLLIGIPTDDDLEEVLPGWEMPVRPFFPEPGTMIPYAYDFGDGWKHEVLIEGIFLSEPGTAYPRCLAGERACPPEDCGGISGYANVLTILKSPDHPEHRETIAWLRHHPGHYHPYAPDAFTPEAVRFDDPRKRWRQA